MWCKNSQRRINCYTKSNLRTWNEITGSIDELSKISNHDQLDKKIAFKPEESSKLELKDLSLIEELKAYLKYIKVQDTNAIITEFQELNIQWLL